MRTVIGWTILVLLLHTPAEAAEHVINAGGADWCNPTISDMRLLRAE